jgi:hypothetical protein
LQDRLGILVSGYDSHVTILVWILEKL